MSDILTKQQWLKNEYICSRIEQGRVIILLTSAKWSGKISLKLLSDIFLIFALH